MIEQKENGLAVDTVDQIYWEILDTLAWHMTKGQSEYEAAAYSCVAHVVDELRKMSMMVIQKKRQRALRSENNRRNTGGYCGFWKIIGYCSRMRIAW